MIYWIVKLLYPKENASNYFDISHLHDDYLHIDNTVYPKKYAQGFCFAVLCCGYTLTDFPISIRLTSLALWQSNDCPSASKATLMNVDKYFMWIHYERLHNHNKAKHNKTVCIFLGIYCNSFQFHKHPRTVFMVPLQRSWKRGILVSHRLSVCPSVRLWQNRVRCVTSTILTGFILYLHI